MKKLSWIALLAVLSLPAIAWAQCSSAGSTNAGVLTPTTSWQTINRAAGAPYYYTITVSTCNTYTFTFCQGGGSATFDTQISITDNTAGTTYYAYNDDNCGLQSQVVWTPTASGTYRVHITQYTCANPSAAATLAYIYASANTTNVNYALVGNASSSSPYNCTTLTSASNNQLGCAWDVNSTLDFTTNFTYDFTINLGSSNAGADGMSFTIQNDSRGLCACGVAGGSMGAGTISNSLIVEIDTYINTEDRDDFTGADYIGCNGALDLDHIDIWTGGNVNPNTDGNCNTTAAAERPALAWAVALKNGGSYYDIENGLNHTLRISWATGSPGTLTAQVMDATASVTYGTASYSFNPLTVFGTNTPYFGFTASTGGLNNVQSFCNPASLLPVELLQFTATKQGNNGKLMWTTSSEKNNKYFMLERSADGETWSDLAKVNSTAPYGNSLTSLSYSFTDGSLLSGSNYYRLKQVDYNGKSSYSSIRSIYNQRTTPIVFPNPFENNFNVNVLSEQGSQIKYVLYNNLGQIVLSAEETQGAQGNFAKKIEVTRGPGLYYLLLEVNEERFTYKLICK